MKITNDLFELFFFLIKKILVCFVFIVDKLLHSIFIDLELVNSKI